MAGPLGHVADGFLPSQCVGQMLALDVAAAGETHEGRVHVGQHLHQIGAQPVGAAFEGILREQRNHVQPKHARRIDGEHQPGVGVVGGGLERLLELPPGGVDAVDRGQRDHPAILFLDGDVERASHRAVRSSVERQSIFLAGLDCQSAGG